MVYTYVNQSRHHHQYHHHLCLRLLPCWGIHWSYNLRIMIFRTDRMSPEKSRNYEFCHHHHLLLLHLHNRNLVKWWSATKDGQAEGEKKEEEVEVAR